MVRSDDWMRCSCPAGTRYFAADNACAPYVEDPPVTPPCFDCDGVGQPINPGTGNMWHVERDYAVGNPNSGLSLVRTYNSNPMHVDAKTAYLFGVGWSVPFDAVIKPEPSAAAAYSKGRCYHRTDIDYRWCEFEPPETVKPTFATTPPGVTVSRGGGRRFFFKKSGADWVADTNINDRLRANYSADNSRVTSWIYTSAIGDLTEVYDDAGRLISITTRAGATRRLTYASGTSNDTATSRLPVDAPACNDVHGGALLPAGRLLCVTDDGGRQIQFGYNDKGLVSRVIEPSKRETLYEYDGPSGGCATAGDTGNAACAANNLTKVTYPDGKSKTYWYNESAYLKNSAGLDCPAAYKMPAGFGHLLNSLTGLIDEHNQRYISWTYHCNGRATSSELAGGVEKVTIAYDVPTTGQRTLTHFLGTAANPASTQSVLSYDLVQTVPFKSGVSQQCVECGAVRSRIPDVNGNVASSTDWSGTVTNYVYDTVRNLEKSRTEAVGTPQARKITTEWHPTFRLPARIAEGGRRTVFAYYPNGTLQSKTEQATSDATGASGFAAPLIGSARVWRYTYNATGQIKTVVSPRTDVIGKTTYDYDSQGNLNIITNAANQQTVLSDYDADGRPGKITDPNKLETILRYHPRGWLISSESAGEKTSYEHDAAGQLQYLTLPDMTKITYTYDAAHRLTGIADNLGNTITYTLDLTGNRKNEAVRDPSNKLIRNTDRVFTLLNQIKRVTGAQQ